MRLLSAGDAAVLVELEPAVVLSFAAVLQEQPHPAVTDVVPAERTILVRFEPALARPAQIADWLHSRPHGSSRPVQHALESGAAMQGGRMDPRQCPAELGGCG